MSDEAMRTPQQDRSRRTLERILSASIEILTERGWDAVTVGEVERRSGVSRGAFYARFPTREALLDHVKEQVMHRVYRDQVAALQHLDQLSESFEEAVPAAVDAISVIFREHGQLLTHVDRHGHNESGRDSLQRLSDHVLAAFTAHLDGTAEAHLAAEFSLRLVFDSLLARTRGISPFPFHTYLDWDQHLTSLTLLVSRYLEPFRPDPVPFPK